MTDGEGRYRLDLPIHSVAYEVSVSCWKNGFRRAHRSGVKIDGDLKELDFTLQSGLSIRGSVNAQGSREGLERPRRIVATKGLAYRPDALFSTLAEWNLDAYEVATPDSTCSFGRSGIGMQGEFEIAGLEEGEYSLRIVDDGWIVSPPIAVPAGSESVFVNAIPCQTLIMLAMSQGREISSFHSYFSLEELGDGAGNSLTLAAGTTAGRIEMRFDPRIWGAGAVFPEQGVPIKYRLSAQGFMAVSGTHVVPSRGASTIIVDLDAYKKDLRTLEMELEYADGQPWKADKALELSYGFAGSLERHASPVSFRGGRATVELPEGTWWLHVRPAGPLGWASAVAVEAQVGPQGGTVLGVRMPNTGTIEILSKRGVPTPVVLSGPRYSTSFLVPAAGMVLEDATPGTWNLKWTSGLSEAQSSALVVAGGRSTLTMDY